jgi:hypothetical protein
MGSEKLELSNEIIFFQPFLFPVSHFLNDWLGWEDSNLRVQVPKTCVLPLDDTPIFFEAMSNAKVQIPNQIQSSNVKPFSNLDFDIHLAFEL